MKKITEFVKDAAKFAGVWAIIIYSFVVGYCDKEQRKLFHGKTR